MDPTDGIVEQHAPLEVLESEELVALATSQASILDLLANDSPLEDVIIEILAQLRGQWESTSVFAVWPTSNDDAKVLVPNGEPAVPDDVLRNLWQSATEPSLHDLVIMDGTQADGVSIAHLTLDVPWLDRLAILGGTIDGSLDGGEQTKLIRHARFAQLAIDRHQNELTLQRLIAEERQSLAGIIHDDPIQAMTAVGLRLQRLTRFVDGEAADILGDARTAVSDAIDRMRRLIVEFHPPTLDDEGLAEAIDEYFAQVLEPLGIECRIVDEELSEEPPTATASLAYQLVTEALWNAAKHANPETVTVELRGDLGSIEAVITDDGSGFDVKPLRRRAGHMGLSSCRQLALRASGTWDIESRVGQGTTVRFTLPGPVAFDGEAATI